MGLTLAQIFFDDNVPDRAKVVAMLKKILCALTIMLAVSVQAEAKDEADRYKLYITQISE